MMDLLNLGIGGAVGAAIAVLVAGARLSASWSALREAILADLGSRNDPPAVALREALDAHEGAVSQLSASVAKLKRALRFR